jgi:hypothetical protein
MHCYVCSHQRVADQQSSLEEEAGPSQPPGMMCPSRPPGLDAVFEAVTPARPSDVSGRNLRQAQQTQPHNGWPAAWNCSAASIPAVQCCGRICAEGAGSSYEDIRARNITLLAKSPLAAGSPWQPSGHPRSILQSSSMHSSGAFGTPIRAQHTPLPSSRPLHTAGPGPSRFGSLRDGPGSSPLPGTPAHLPRSTVR